MMKLERAARKEMMWESQNREAPPSSGPLYGVEWYPNWIYTWGEVGAVCSTGEVFWESLMSSPGVAQLTMMPSPS